jgi:phosphate acetyltransferase
MDTIQMLRQKARQRPKKIVLPEYDDRRTLEAVRIIEKEKIANVVLLTKDKIDSSQKERYIQQFYAAHQAHKDLDIDTVKKLFDDTLYYAAMLTAEGQVDGLVAGATHTTTDMARAVMRCIGIDERISIISSCFIMVVPDCPYGDQGTFVFADCGIIPDPLPRQLACIGLAAAEFATKVLNLSPRIAYLSYSTKGSASSKSAQKIIEAVGLLKEMDKNILADGELQVDTAIVPEVAKIKYPDSPVDGKANILIFPSLDAGNIGYKLVQRLANARALGPLFLGLKKPASDLSRGCIVDDIVDCVAVTAIRAE